MQLADPVNDPDNAAKEETLLNAVTGIDISVQLPCL